LPAVANSRVAFKNLDRASDLLLALAQQFERVVEQELDTRHGDGRLLERADLRSTTGGDPTRPLHRIRRLRLRSKSPISSAYFGKQSGALNCPLISGHGLLDAAADHSH
jgi:hypothetical protein